MEEKPVVVPQDPFALTDEEKKTALETVNLIKEKWNGVLKGHTRANGDRQLCFV